MEATKPGDEEKLLINVKDAHGDKGVDDCERRERFRRLNSKNKIKNRIRIRIRTF
jgi:hypothetical protein